MDAGNESLRERKSYTCLLYAWREEGGELSKRAIFSRVRAIARAFFTRPCARLDDAGESIRLSPPVKLFLAHRGKVGCQSKFLRSLPNGSLCPASLAGQ